MLSDSGGRADWDLHQQVSQPPLLRAPLRPAARSAGSGATQGQRSHEDALVSVGAALSEGEGAKRLSPVLGTGEGCGGEEAEGG